MRKWIPAIVLATFWLCIFGYWSRRGYEDWHAQRVSAKMWNQRGFIGCVDGWLEIRNIDVGQLPWHMDGVIDVRGIDCGAANI